MLLTNKNWRIEMTDLTTLSLDDVKQAMAANGCPRTALDNVTGATFNRMDAKTAIYNIIFHDNFSVEQVRVTTAECRGVNYLVAR